ncbi:MAG: nitroreductase family protein [Clostridiaceae bacterium]|nr:nitroreductase family protein [Clostridiaceae bacterium]
MSNLVLETIMQRRSIRSYKEDQIDEVDLQSILAAGIQAPSANNCQPWHFTVIQDKEFIQYMNERSKEIMINSEDERISKAGNGNVNLFYNAPTLIVVSGNENEISAKVDCSAAIENMLIAAESLKIGGVWIGMLRFFISDNKEVRKLNLPDNFRPFYAVALGYKKDDAIPSPSKRNKDVVAYIR